MFFFFPFGGPFAIIFILFILLRLIINSLGFRHSNRSNYNYHYYQYQDIPHTESQTNTSSKAYSVLGLTPSATNEEIKKAYRKLTLEFHPDTIAGKGLGKEFTDFAAKRFREVQEAYEQICKERGIR